MYPLIVFLVSALLCTLALLIFRGKRDSWFDVFLKSITVAFCALGFIRLWLPDGFAFVYNGAVVSGVKVENADFLQSILRWGEFASYSVLPMAVFYKGRFFRNVASYFCLPFSIACAFYFNDFMGYFLIDKRLGVHFDVSVWLDTQCLSWSLSLQFLFLSYYKLKKDIISMLKILKNGLSLLAVFY